MKLVKVFDDDLSWQIYDLMVESYFAQQTMVSASGQKHDIKMTIDIGRLAQQADRQLDGKSSLRLLHHLIGIPVNDLVHEIEVKETNKLMLQPGKEAEVLVSYLFALVNDDKLELEIDISIDDDGFKYVRGQTVDLMAAMKMIGKANRLPTLDYEVMSLGSKMAKLAPAIEELGWRRKLDRIITGKRYYKYTCLEVLG